MSATMMTPNNAPPPSADAAPVIRCRNLSKRFGDVLAVDSVDLDVWRGEIVAVLGGSGCGKTTLLRLIAGFELPAAGEILIRGERMSSAGYAAPPDSRGVGMVVQEYALFPNMTVARNAAFGLDRLSPSERSERARRALALVNLDDLGDRYPHELSGGQQQRAAVARALAPSPVTVLLDEPFSNLDSAMTQRLRREVESILRSQGASAIFVTHDREEAFAIADRVGVMAEGRMPQIDAPERVYHRPATPEIARLTGTCDFIPGEVRADGAIETELGALPAAVKTPAGSRVQVMLRPDYFDLTPDPNGRAAITAREFRGDETLLRIRLESGAQIRIRRRSFSTIPAGARAELRAARESGFMAYGEG